MGTVLGAGVLLAFAAGAAQAGAPGKTVQDACRNEAGLFCPGRTGQALKRCLNTHRQGASRACKAHLDSAPGADGEALPDPTAVDKLRFPDLAIEENIVTYAVDGADVDELGSAMDRLGPFDPSLKRHASGKTKDDIRWSFKSRQQSGGCAVESALVSVSVVQDYPQWQTPSGAKDIVVSWQRFMTALRTHEDGHKEIAFKTALGILQTLKTISPQADCQALKKAADEAAAVWFAQEKQQNLDYDRLTKHGATQGAVLR